MSHEIQFTVDEAKVRLDQYLTEKLPDLSRTKIKSMIKNGLIKVNTQIVKPSMILTGNEEITGEYEVVIDEDISPEKMALDILYEDEEISVINKPSGLVVHPGSGNQTGTLVNGLVHHYQSLSTNDPIRPGIVHRLDKETSGVILIAKTDFAHQKISEQFANRTVKKIYKALVWGQTENSGMIEGNIGRHPHNRQAFTLDVKQGRDSKTLYKTNAYYQPLSWVSLMPKTGRTHQLRVHFKSIGHPIFADELYSGGKKMIKSFHTKHTQFLNILFKLLNRVALHAEKLEISHPVNGKKITFQAPIPTDMMLALKALKDAE